MEDGRLKGKLIWLRKRGKKPVQGAPEKKEHRAGKGKRIHVSQRTKSLTK